MHFKAFEEALLNNDYSSLLKIDKADLHAHAYLSAGWNIYKELNPNITTPPKFFNGFSHFLSWLEDNRVAPNKTNYAKIIFSAFNRMINEGVIYTEMSFDLHDCMFMKMTIAEWGKMIQDLYKPFSKRLQLCLELGINRKDEPETSIKYVEKAIKSAAFQSIDLYGDELCRPISNFNNIYKLAKSAKMKLKAHVGEFGSAYEVLSAIECLNLHSVQHGNNAVNDEKVMSCIRERGVTLNICPSSNIALGLYKSIYEHPIRKLFDKGIRITINSDDYMLFNSGISNEILLLYKSKIFNTPELWEIITNGLQEASRKCYIV